MASLCPDTAYAQVRIQASSAVAFLRRARDRRRESDDPRLVACEARSSESSPQYSPRSNLRRDPQNRLSHLVQGQRASSILVETLEGFPNLPAKLRGQQSWPAPHARLARTRVQLSSAHELCGLAAIVLEFIVPSSTGFHYESARRRLVWMHEQFAHGRIQDGFFRSTSLYSSASGEMPISARGYAIVAELGRPPPKRYQACSRCHP